MDRIEPYRCIPYSRGDSLSVKLAALYTYYDELPRVLRFELPQLREYVNAVDSPIRPEVEQDDLASQIGKPELLPARMDPVEIIGKLGCSYCGRGGKLSWHLASFIRLERRTHPARNALPRAPTNPHIVFCARKLL